MKQKKIIWLAISILSCVLFAGCENKKPEQPKETVQNMSSSNSQNQPQSDQKNTETSDVQNNTSGTNVPAGEVFVYHPIVDSPFYESAYSKKHMQSYRNMIHAVMEHKRKFKIKKGVDWWEIQEFVYYLFPAFDYVIDHIDQKGTTGKIVYKNDKATTETILTEFAKKVEWWINSCTKPDDPDVLKALEIYHKLSSEFTYDYDALDDPQNSENMNIDVSPYRAIMESSGICQSFAPAYSYLLMQIGIDACPTGGLQKDNSTAHVWTALKLYDKWYYADVTYENSSVSEGKSLFYFGETTKKRSKQDNYSIETINIGECNRIWGNDMDFSDKTFFCLDDINEVKEMTYDSEHIIIEGLDLENQPITVKLPLE